MKFSDHDTVQLLGVYLITDPCYIPALADDWGKFCDDFWCCSNHHAITICEHDLGKIALKSTAYGDGSYRVYRSGIDIGSFGVDSGLYAFVPSGLIADDVAADLIAKGLATRVEFTEPQTLKSSLASGDVMVGDVSVYTSGDDLEEFPDDEDPYEDEDKDELEKEMWDDATAEDAENYEQRVDSGLIL